MEQFFRHLGRGICCKNDEALNYFGDHPTLFSHIKFFIIADDDVYFRGDQMLRWLSIVAHSGINHLPIVANSRANTEIKALEHVKLLNSGKDGLGGIWMISNCSEIETGGWYSPYVLNHAAVKRLLSGTSKFGMSQTCTNFDVSQDAGLGIFFWMYQLYHIQIPNYEKAVQDSYPLTPKDLYKHGVKHRQRKD